MEGPLQKQLDRIEAKLNAIMLDLGIARHSIQAWEEDHKDEWK